MIRRTVYRERSIERSHSIQDSSTEISTWHFVCATLALMLLLCMVTLNAHGAAIHPSQPPASPSTASARAKLASSYFKVPLSFEPNLGQSGPDVQFLSRNSGYSLFLAPAEAVLTLKRPNPSANANPGTTIPAPPAVDILRMQLLGASTTAPATGLDPQPGVTNYFLGNDPQKWHTGIPTYGKVNYAGIYPGIDLVFYVISVNWNTTSS